MIPRKPERISVDPDQNQLQKDLEKYRKKSIELGATRAAIVDTSDIPVDERVILKCRVPRCFGYASCPNCPPYTIKPSELREYLSKYRYAVFFTIEVPADVIVRDKKTINERVAAYQKIYGIVSEIESAAFYDGHYLAFGFGAGSCRHTFCGLEDDCQALKGKKCRFSLRSRPSMEAVGIDVYRMTAVRGWEIYPIGSNAAADDVPHGTLAGIVIVA